MLKLNLSQWQVSRCINSNLMTREEKSQMIVELTETINDANVFDLTDTSELNAEQTSNLRRECFKSGIQLKVVKNTLLHKALEAVEGKDFGPLLETLKGNTSLMVAEAGNAPAKLIKEFRKQHEKPILKAAYVEEECYVGDDQLGNLAEIKSKDELIGDVIMLLQSPMKTLVGQLQSGQNTVGGLLKALEERA